MTEPDNDPQEPADDEDPFPFGDFEVETEALPDRRQIHYYRWPATEPEESDV